MTKSQTNKEEKPDFLTEKDIEDFRQLRQQLSSLLNSDTKILLGKIQSIIGAGDKKPVSKTSKLTKQQKFDELFNQLYHK